MSTDAGVQKTPSLQDATFRPLLEYVPEKTVTLTPACAHLCPRPLLQHLHRRVRRHCVQLLQPYQGMSSSFPLHLEATERPTGQARNRVDVFVDSVKLNLALPCMDGLSSAVPLYLRILSVVNDPLHSMAATPDAYYRPGRVAWNLPALTLWMVLTENKGIPPFILGGGTRLLADSPPCMSKGDFRLSDRFSVHSLMTLLLPVARSRFRLFLKGPMGSQLNMAVGPMYCATRQHRTRGSSVIRPTYETDDRLLSVPMAYTCTWTKERHQPIRATLSCRRGINIECTAARHCRRSLPPHNLHIAVGTEILLTYREQGASASIGERVE